MVPLLAEGWSHVAVGTHVKVVPCSWRATSVAPAWGGWVALLTSCVLIVGSLSRWSVCITIRDDPSETGGSLLTASATGETVYGIPRQSGATDTDVDESRTRLPRLDEVLAPPTLSDG